MSDLLKPIIDGGPVIWGLLAFSVVAVSIVLLKLWQFLFQYRLFTSGVDREIEGLLINSNVSHIGPYQHPRLMSVEHALNTSSKASLSPEQVKEESFRFARSHLNSLNGQLRGLEIIATLAPLLGLFGTVLGMIEAFKAMELAGSQVDPSVLSAGIWQALSTTALGLGVAIPVSLFHGWLERTVEVTGQQLQDDLEKFFIAIASRVSRTSPVEAVA